MSGAFDEEIASFLTPAKLWNREEVLRRPSPVPAVVGQ